MGIGLNLKSNQTTTTVQQWQRSREGRPPTSGTAAAPSPTPSPSSPPASPAAGTHTRNAPSLPSPASRTSHFNLSPRRSRRFGDDELRVLEAALSSGGDVAAMLATRSEARRMLRERSTEAFAAAAAEEVGARLSVADFFARAFALAGDVESCLATRYEALLLREAKYSDDPHLHVSHEEWLTFAQDSLDNGFYAIASKAFANALVHNHSSTLDSTNPILKKSKINDIRGLQNLAKSLSGQRSVQAQSAEYMKRKAPSISEKCNLHSEKPKLPGNMMFRLGIKTRNTQKLLCSRKRNLEDV